MADARDLDEARLGQRSGRNGSNGTATRDNDNISLTLRPADFYDEPHNAARPDAYANSTLGSSRQSRSNGAVGQPRGAANRRELVELAGNPFVFDPRSPHMDGEPRFRQDIYPAYDASGKRIGLNHVRNGDDELDKGYYRKHVHEYDAARGAALPLPSPSPTQVPIQSRYPEQGPLPPVSAVIAGMTSDSHYGVGTFSPIQNRPRTPHEILGLPTGVPLNLWSLLDPEIPNTKPQYNYHVLVKLAILGNKGQKATLQEILRAIRLRFPYYDNLPNKDAIAFANSIRHLLSLLAAFVREPKPVTEPGKGAYWRVDFSKGEGNKRERKRNKRRKTNDCQPSDKQDCEDDKEKRDRRSQSDDSHPSASTETETSTEYPVSRYAFEGMPQTPRPKGGRRPAPKNLITTPNGGTAIISVFNSSAHQNESYEHLDYRLMNKNPDNFNSIPRTTGEPYLQLYPNSIGAHRERVARGSARSAPYPSPLVMPSGASSSDSVSATSEHEHQHSSTSPVDARMKNEYYMSASPSSSVAQLRHEVQHNGRNVFRADRYHGYQNNAYSRHHSLNDRERFVSESPQVSPLSDQSRLSPYTDRSSLLSSNSSQYPDHLPQKTSFEEPSPASATYGISPLGSTSDGESMSTHRPTASTSSSYGFAPYSQSQNANATYRPHDERTYPNSAPWNSTPVGNPQIVESSGSRR